MSSKKAFSPFFRFRGSPECELVIPVSLIAHVEAAECLPWRIGPKPLGQGSRPTPTALIHHGYRDATGTTRYWVSHRKHPSTWILLAEDVSTKEKTVAAVLIEDEVFQISSGRKSSYVDVLFLCTGNLASMHKSFCFFPRMVLATTATSACPRRAARKRTPSFAYL